MSWCNINLPLDVELLVIEYQKVNGIRQKKEAIIGLLRLSQSKYKPCVVD